MVEFILTIAYRQKLKLISSILSTTNQKLPNMVTVWVAPFSYPIWAKSRAQKWPKRFKIAQFGRTDQMLATKMGMREQCDRIGQIVTIWATFLNPFEAYFWTKFGIF